MQVAKAILFEIIDSGAQFLKKDKSRNYWYIADVKVGKDKISHVLRIMKRAKESRESARASQQEKRPSSPNHSHGDVSELEAQQLATSPLQQQQATARAAASIMSLVEPIILPRPEHQYASNQQPTMRRTGHIKISDGYQQSQSSGKNVVDSGSRINIVDILCDHKQRQSGNGIVSDDGSVTTFDARGSSILDDGMVANDQPQRFSHVIRTSRDSFSSMDFDEFADDRCIGQLMADWS